MSEATRKIAQRLGRKGGKAILHKYGKEYFKELRAKGVKKQKRRKLEAGKAIKIELEVIS